MEEVLALISCQLFIHINTLNLGELEGKGRKGSVFVNSIRGAHCNHDPAQRCSALLPHGFHLKLNTESELLM